MTSGDHALLVWDFHFRKRILGKEKRQTIRGTSHLRFDKNGRVCYHRDYWDAASEVYTDIPILGWVMRKLKKAFAAKRAGNVDRRVSD